MKIRLEYTAVNAVFLDTIHVLCAINSDHGLWPITISLRKRQRLYHCVQWPPVTWTGFIRKQNQAVVPRFSRYILANSIRINLE